MSRTLNSSQTYFTALQVFSCLYIAVIWYNRSLVSTNLVTLRRARLVLEWVTARAIESVALAQCWYLISQPGQLNLAIPLWVGKISRPTCDGHDYYMRRNVDFCVTAAVRGPELLTLFNSCWLKDSKGGELPRNGPRCRLGNLLIFII